MNFGNSVTNVSNNGLMLRMLNIIKLSFIIKSENRVEPIVGFNKHCYN